MSVAEVVEAVVFRQTSYEVAPATGFQVRLIEVGVEPLVASKSVGAATLESSSRDSKPWIENNSGDRRRKLSFRRWVWR
jgi:hypothetical protein